VDRHQHRHGMPQCPTRQKVSLLVLVMSAAALRIDPSMAPTGSWDRAAFLSGFQNAAEIPAHQVRCMHRASFRPGGHVLPERARTIHWLSRAWRGHTKAIRTDIDFERDAPRTDLVRYTLDLKSGSYARRALSTRHLEYPSIARLSVSGRRYRFVYTTAGSKAEGVTPVASVLKTDTEAPQIRKFGWRARSNTAVRSASRQGPAAPRRMTGTC